MASKHPLPPSLNLTGVFQGKPKQVKSKNRKGQVPGGSDLRPLESFTFLAPSPSTLTAAQIFDGEQEKNLLFLIERARAGGGSYSIDINTSSLLLTTKSRKLELFKTQSPIMNFSATRDFDEVKGRIFYAIDLATRTAANVSSGLSLHCVKCVTLIIGPASGLKGAGAGKNALPQSISWANRVQIRGAISLKVDTADLAKHPEMAQQCFKFAVLHNLFSCELREQKKSAFMDRCVGEGHVRLDGQHLCLACSLLFEHQLQKEEEKASTFLPWSERLDWSGLEFPIGLESYDLFCRQNPSVRLFVYRQVEAGGEIYQEYKSEPSNEDGEEEIKNVHIIFTSRVDWEENEIQSHFLSVTNLAKLCAKLLKYDIKGKKTSKYSDRNICETCHRLFTFDKKEALGPQLKKLKRDMVNGDWCRFKSQAYLEHVASCSSNSLATIRMPKEGATASFSKISALHDKPVITHFFATFFFLFYLFIIANFQVSIYADFETTHKSLSSVCHDCLFLYKEARGSQREKVIQRCEELGHFSIPGASRCEHCLQKVMESLENARLCNICPKHHVKKVYKGANGEDISYHLCQQCFEGVTMDSRLNPPCTHSKTSADAFLDVVSFSIVVVENYGPPSDERGDQIAYPRLLKQISVVAEESESGRDILLKFWRELQGLRKLISKKWAGNFADLKDISISKSQQDELDKAAFCYACQKPFDPPKQTTTEDNELSDRLEELPAFKKRTRNRDHCHRSGAIRGWFFLIILKVKC